MMSIKESGWAGKSKALATLCLVLLMGVLTAQSNTMLGLPAVANSDTPRKDYIGMQFFLDGALLDEGLKFSELKSYKGQFKFEFANNEVDNIRVGLDLLRKGKVVANVSGDLKEGTVFDIRRLLDLAAQNDYLVIDVIDGPAAAIKLYEFPLFRESDGWKMSQMSDLPPPPVALFVDGAAVGPGKGLSLSNLKANGMNARLEYVLSEFVDFNVLSSQAGGVEVALLRNEKKVKLMTDTNLEPKASMDLSFLLKEARKGDEVMVSFGKRDGLSFGSKFSIE